MGDIGNLWPRITARVCKHGISAFKQLYLAVVAEEDRKAAKKVHTKKH
jgi:hypothetical protein